jgi:hypothetical protein
MPILLPDSEDEQKSQRANVITPFAVFGIILGCGIILIRMLPLFGKFESSINIKILNISVLISSFGGLVTSLVLLRFWLRGSLIDRFMYFFMAGIFLTLIIFYSFIISMPN